MKLYRTLIGAAVGAPFFGPVGSLVGAIGGAVSDWAHATVVAKPVIVATSPLVGIVFRRPAPDMTSVVDTLVSRADATLATKRAADMKAAAQHVAFILHKPRRDAQPADILKYAGTYNLRDLYPEWPWVHETGTKYHADYDFGSSDHVHWYVNGQQGYQHTWGGVDFGRLVGQTFDDIDQVLGAVESVAAPLGTIVDVVPWQDIADGIEAGTSTIPILGTAVSDYVATIQTVIEAISGKSAQEISFRSAYNYLMATTPGAAALRPLLDPVVNVLVAIINGKVANPKDAINAAVSNLPSGLPRQLAASLVGAVVGSIGIH